MAKRKETVRFKTYYGWVAFKAKIPKQKKGINFRYKKRKVLQMQGGEIQQKIIGD